MPNPTWAVRFAVEDAQANALSAVGHLIAVEREVRSIHFEAPSEGDPGGPATVTFEIVERDSKCARLLAQYFLSKAKRAAGLRDDSSPVVWVNLLASTSDGSGRRFLEAAEELMEAERYDLGLVAAQIHLEAHVAGLVRAAIGAEKADEDVVRHDEKRGGWAPHRKPARRLLEPLLGVDMEQFPRWADYWVHVRRRNDVAHEGKPVDRESAMSSLAVVQELWTWLNEAAAAKGLT